MAATIPDFFGLNLGHNSIKMAQSRAVSRQKVKLIAIGSTPTSFGLLENDSAKGQDMLSQEIANAYKSYNIKTKNCVMSVSEVLVFSRLITLPKMNDNEVDEAIQYALKPLVPIPIEEVNISYLKIDEKKFEGNVFSNWYVVAAPKQLIARYQQIIEKAGLNLLAVETESLATTRMITANYPSEIAKDLMILDLGAESTNVILSRNGVVMFSQTISTGSDAITKVIAADFGIDIIQAEKYKITFGIDFNNGEGKIARSIEPILQIIVSEVQRTLTYYQEKIGGPGISNIYLTGGGADLPSLDAYLTSKLNITAQSVNPLQNVEVDRSMIESVLPQLHVKGFNVAIGLSLKGYFE